MSPEVNGVSANPVRPTAARTVKVELSEDELAAQELDKQIKQAVKEEKVDEFKKTVEESSKTTKTDILATVASALFASTVALKLAPVARRSVAKIGAIIANGGISVMEKIGNKFPKLNVVNAEKAKEAITKYSEALKNSESTRIVDWVKKQAQDILGKDLSIKTMPVISSIKNDVGIIDAGIATAVGYQSIQPNSEKTNNLINAANSVLVAC